MCVCRFLYFLGNDSLCRLSFSPQDRFYCNIKPPTPSSLSSSSHPASFVWQPAVLPWTHCCFWVKHSTPHSILCLLCDQHTQHTHRHSYMLSWFHITSAKDIFSLDFGLYLFDCHFSTFPRFIVTPFISVYAWNPRRKRKGRDATREKDRQRER